MSDTSSGWSTSDEDSSGNEYSLKTRKDKLEQASEESKVHKRSKKKKKRKKKKKSKKSKREKRERHSEDDEDSPDDDDDDDHIRKKRGGSTTVTSTKTVVETTVQKECVKNPPEKTGTSKSKKRSRSRSLSNESKRSGKRSCSPNKRKPKDEKMSQDKKSNLNDNSAERKFLVKSESPERKSRAKSKSPERKSRARSRSRSPGRSRKRSRSQDERCKGDRDKDVRSRRSTSRDRRNNRKKRSRSRDGNRSHDRRAKRSHSKEERKRSRSRSRDRKRSRSRSRERRKSSRSLSRERRHKSRSRSRERRRTRSRSRDRRRSRSRSRDRKRKSNLSPSPRKSESKTKEPEKPKAPTSWDVRTLQVPVVVEENKISINSRIEQLETITTTHEKDTFNSSTLINKQSIEIKLPPPVPVGKPKEDPKSAVYGKWEPFQPQSNPTTVGKSTNANLSKFMRMCQEISAKEGDDDAEKVRNREEQNVHHPFAVKEAPLYTPPQMRPGKHSVPTNPGQAILQGSLNSLTETTPSGPLESIFPVSSGTDHQTKYNETRTDENAGENTLVYEKKETEEEINVSAVIARRLGAQQILAVNPSDYSAQLVLTECDQKLKQWSTSKNKPGKFTGEVTQTKMNKKNMFQTQFAPPTLTKDFFHNLRPVTGGIGMKMLQNMGWKEGEALGKSKEGFVVPIAVDLKVGRQGLSAEDEMPQYFPQQYQTPQNMGHMMQPPRRRPAPIVNINGKHPVSALAEHCSKSKMGIPEYSVVAENGQAHGKMFMMSVLVESVSYQPTEASPNKKHAKAMAATVALKSLGLMPTDA